MAKTIYLANGTAVRVDPQDYEFVAQFGDWYSKKSHGKVHAFRQVVVGDKTVGQRMQRVITAAKANEKVLFKDGDTLNLTRGNLKVIKRNARTNHFEEHARGVSQKGNRFRARINVAGKEINLGSFTTREDAAAAYDDAAKRLHGNRAVTNS